MNHCIQENDVLRDEIMSKPISLKLVDCSMRVFTRPSYLPTHPFTYLSTYLPIYLSTYLSIYLPIHLSIYLPMHLSTYLSIHPSIYLPIYLLTFPYHHIWVAKDSNMYKHNVTCTFLKMKNYICKKNLSTYLPV